MISFDEHEKDLIRQLSTKPNGDFSMEIFERLVVGAASYKRKATKKLRKLATNTNPKKKRKKAKRAKK